MNALTRRLAAVAVAAGLVAGCGGGGGGGSSGFSYDGNTSQAQLTQANSQEFLEVTLDGSESGDAFTSSSARAPTASSSDLDVVTLGRLLKDSVGRIGTGSVPGGPMTSDLQSDSDSETGPCGGSLSYSITFDDQTGAFNGTINYRRFCADDVEINGAARFSGTLDLADLSLQDFTLTVDLLSVTDGTDTVELSGAISIDISSPGIGIVAYDLNWRVNGKIYRLASFEVQINENVSPAETTLTGRLFHPDHGFVDVTTTTPIQESINGTPQAGVIEFEGDGGTKATVTFIDDNTYTIEVDEDGDSFTDVTLNCTWSPAECV